MYVYEGFLKYRVNSDSLKNLERFFGLDVESLNQNKFYNYLAYFR